MPLVIGGYQPFSLSDYPGCASAVVFAQGCNWRCPHCHNPGLLPTTPAAGAALDPDVVLQRLSKRRGLLRGVVVSGGEPTTQPAALPGFLAAVKALGFRVKLDTNGSRPEVLAAILRDGLVDFVAMDLKAPPHLYARLAGCPVAVDTVRHSAALIAASGVAHQFRTTWVAPPLTEVDRPAILDLVPAGSAHVWQRFVATQD